MSLSKRWHIFAIGLGVLGFLAILALLVAPPSPQYLCGIDPVRYCPNPDYIDYETGPTLVRAAISFFLWTGIGYGIAFSVAAIRWVIRRVRGGGGRS